jgi:hypothetical protein
MVLGIDVDSEDNYGDGALHGDMTMGFWFWVLGFGFWVLGFGFWVLGFGFLVFGFLGLGLG